MSDEELERLARRAIATDGKGREGFRALGEFNANATPDAFLALLERVRKAEAARQEWSDRAGEWQQNAKEYARRAESAEAQLATIAAIFEYEGSEDGVAAEVRRQYVAEMAAVTKAVEARKAAEARVDQLEKFAEGFAQVAEAAISHAENDGKGMQVPFHGDFAQAKRIPSLLHELRWWAREARATLGKP